MPAEFEELVADTDRLNAQHTLPDLHQSPLDIISRLNVGAFQLRSARLGCGK
jgi:hypothetical protein